MGPSTFTRRNPGPLLFNLCCLLKIDWKGRAQLRPGAGDGLAVLAERAAVDRRDSHNFKSELLSFDYDFVDGHARHVLIGTVECRLQLSAGVLHVQHETKIGVGDMDNPAPTSRYWISGPDGDCRRKKQDCELNDSHFMILSKLSV